MSNGGCAHTETITIYYKLSYHNISHVSSTFYVQFTTKLFPNIKVFSNIPIGLDNTMLVINVLNELETISKM